MIRIIEADIKRAQCFLRDLDLKDIEKIMEGMKCGEIFANMRDIVSEDEFDKDTAKQYVVIVVEHIYSLWQANFESQELWYEVTGHPEFSVINDDIYDLTEKNMRKFIDSASDKVVSNIIMEKITTHVEENDRMFYELFKILENGSDPVTVGCIAFFAIKFGLWRYEEAL